MSDRAFMCCFFAAFFTLACGYFAGFMWWLGQLMGYRYALGEGPEPILGCLFLLLSLWLSFYTSGFAFILGRDAVIKIRNYFKGTVDGR